MQISFSPVFSAGVGDVILNLLKKFTKGHLPNNIHIVANWMSWDNGSFSYKKRAYLIEGKFNGIKGEFIHSMNKNEHSVPRESEYYQDVVKRKNAILLGDNVGDVHMSEGKKIAGNLRVTETKDLAMILC